MADLSDLNTFTPQGVAERKALFAKMVKEAGRFKNPDELLQAKIVLTLQFEIKANRHSRSSSKTPRRMDEPLHGPPLPATCANQAVQLPGGERDEGALRRASNPNP